MASLTELGLVEGTGHSLYGDFPWTLSQRVCLSEYLGTQKYLVLLSEEVKFHTGRWRLEKLTSIKHLGSDTCDI